MSYCYILYTADLRQTYIGATVDPDRRLRQHNQELVGGARRTKGNQWKRALYVGGFPDWEATLQFEWSWKRHGRGKYGLAGKIGALLNLLQSEKSTSTATPFRFWNRNITVHPHPDSVHTLGKIERFCALLSVCGRSITNLLPFFLFPSPFLSFLSFLPTMSVPSSVDINALALQVEDLSTTVAQLTARLDAALSAGVKPEPKKRGPKKAAPATDAAPVTATDDATPAPTEVKPAPKKRGPKKKSDATTVDAPVADAATADAPTAVVAEATPKKKRGPNKPKAEPTAPPSTPVPEATEIVPDAPKKKRGPKKAAAEAIPMAPLEGAAEAPTADASA
jgi:predicted GIY-YIG superfamily endonuclease